jgi:spermidine synthase
MLSMETVLYHWRTEFQDVLIFENAVFGMVLMLDGVVQLTERDNHICHEMIAHVPLMAHGFARDVLIIGGGDGGTLKEVLKQPVKSATLVELDDDPMPMSFLKT